MICLFFTPLLTPTTRKVASNPWATRSVVSAFQVLQITDRDAPVHYPSAAITSLDELNLTLADIIGSSSESKLNGSRNGRLLEIDVDDNLPTSQVAELLAWSYGQSAAGAPIFPYFRKQQ